MGRKLTPEMKEKMAAGRKAARERRATAAPSASAATPTFAEPQPGRVEGAEVAPMLLPGDEDRPLEKVPELEIVSDTPFGRFLSGLDAETRELLGDEELLRIFSEQTAAARAAKRAERKKAVSLKAAHHARVEEGLLPQTAAEHMQWQSRMNEMITWTCRLPFDGAGAGSGPPRLYVDQMRYVHGETYTTTRAVYESVAWTMYAAHQHQAQFEGRSQTWYGRQMQNGYMPGFGRGASAAGGTRLN